MPDDLRILALDLGTSSVRSALYDRRGRCLARTLAQKPVKLRSGADGAAELDPPAVQRAIEGCIAATLAGQRVPVAAIGISCFWHSLIGVDAGGAALTPIITWADTRPAAAARALRDELDERATHARTGCMVRPSFWPAKLRWLAGAQPTTVRRVRRWLGPAEWLAARWTGVERASTAMASGTGLFAHASRGWDPEIAAAAGVDPAALPVIDDAALTPTRLARRFPLLAGAALYPALGDGAAANLGSGAARRGVGAITAGTSAAARLVVDDGATAPFGLFRYRVDPARTLIGGAVSNAGNVRAWCLRELRIDDGPALERALRARPGPSPLLAAPYLHGERAPLWRDDVSAAIAGFGGATTALDLMHALTDAAWQRLAVIVEALPGNERARFVVGGGIQRSPATLQRLADVLGRTLHVCDEAETSLRGAAVYAGERLGSHPPAPATRPIAPRARYADAYADQRARLAAFETRLFAQG
ncbi:MAG TPA: FGGY family carbohydrate kinase [Planctomycetota bacterium]|nr:FGGY family carbohydrate kinase [Planctomycetota bacterium]